MIEKQDLKNEQFDIHYDEINLVDIFGVIWKQRWLILCFIMLFVSIAFLYVLLKPPLYEITAQVSPGITNFDKNGSAYRNFSSNNIAAWFSEKAYYNIFPEDKEDILEIEARLIPKTDIVNIVYYSKDPKEGKVVIGKILNEIQNGGKTYFKKALNVGKKDIELVIDERSQEINEIMVEKDKLKNIEKEKIGNAIKKINIDISLLKKKIKTIRSKKLDSQVALENTIKKIKSISKNTETTKKLRDQMIEEGADKIALLMYSNIIQQDIGYTADLQSQLFQLQKELNDYVDQESIQKNKIESLNNKIFELKIDRDKAISLHDKKLKIKIEIKEKIIKNLRMKAKNISAIEIISHPKSSKIPVKPNKWMIVAIFFISGAFFAIVLAFFREFWENNKNSIKNIYDS